MAKSTVSTHARKLYRIIRRTTTSVQPGRDSLTCWCRTVLYCGYDRDEARRVYHESTPTDYWCGYGNRAQETLGQSKVFDE